jgi:hypothetical protein
MKIAHCLIVAAMTGAMGLAGCVVYEPYPYASGTASTYERSWGAALGALRDQGVQIEREDRSAGLIEGRRGPLTVKARVVTQADGRVRVEFNTGGELAADPGLSDRISRAYDARMGR